MIRVTIDGRPLYDGNRYRGIGVYLRCVLRQLANIQSLSVSALVTSGTALPEGIRPVLVSRAASGRFAHLEHEARTPRDLQKIPADVVHSPLQPFRQCSRPWVQTLHDIIPLVYDHPEYRAYRRRWRRYSRYLHSASAVIAVSDYTAQEAIRVFGLDPAKVHVVHHGIDSSFRVPEARSASDPPYLLYVGEYGPNKGYPEAFEAISRLAQAGYPHRLKVVGRIAPWVKPKIDALLARCARPDRVDLLGFVSDMQLPSTYQGASASLVTSRYEGFGFAALESMATGTPVVAFRNSSIAEIAGGGAILVPDGNVDALVGELEALLNHRDYWNRISAQGVVRARDFDWERCAEHHADVFRQVTAQAKIEK